MKRVLVSLLLLTAQPAMSQLTLDDLTARVNERVGTLSSFDDALSDSDPRKALAAMQIMIEQGDSDQRRMAIRSGLYSTDLAIRSTVLRAIMNSAPNLIVELTPVGDEVNQYYPRQIGAFAGTIRPDNSASLVRKLGEWDAEEQCWRASDGNKNCMVKLNADTLSLYLDSWSQLRLDKEGNLTGPANFSQTQVVLKVPLAE